MAPRLLINVNHDMHVMKDETFGPLLPVMKVRDDAEALKLMNDSNFGLTASIWTKDVDGARNLHDEVEAGTVFINRCDFPSPVGFLFALNPSSNCHSPLLTSRATGSLLDRLEGLRTRQHLGTARFRRFHHAQEPPHPSKTCLDRTH